MASVNIQLPADLVLVAKLGDGDVSREVAKLIALELFREDKISMGRAAELCQTPLESLMEFASDHGVPMHYGIDELEADRRTAGDLLDLRSAYAQLLLHRSELMFPRCKEAWINSTSQSYRFPLAS